MTRGKEIGAKALAAAKLAVREGFRRIGAIEPGKIGAVTLVNGGQLGVEAKPSSLRDRLQRLPRAAGERRTVS